MSPNEGGQSGGGIDEYLAGLSLEDFDAILSGTPAVSAVIPPLTPVPPAVVPVAPPPPEGEIITTIAALRAKWSQRKFVVTFTRDEMADLYADDVHTYLTKLSRTHALMLEEASGGIIITDDQSTPRGPRTLLYDIRQSANENYERTTARILRGQSATVPQQPAAPLVALPEEGDDGDMREVDMGGATGVRLSPSITISAELFDDSPEEAAARAAAAVRGLQFENRHRAMTRGRVSFSDGHRAPRRGYHFVDSCEGSLNYATEPDVAPPQAAASAAPAAEATGETGLRDRWFDSSSGRMAAADDVMRETSSWPHRNRDFLAITAAVAAAVLAAVYGIHRANQPAKEESAPPPAITETAVAPTQPQKKTIVSAWCQEKYFEGKKGTKTLYIPSCDFSNRLGTTVELIPVPDEEQPDDPLIEGVGLRFVDLRLKLLDGTPCTSRQLIELGETNRQDQVPFTCDEEPQP